MKVAIVGGGICGLYLAWKLAKRGESVTVFEKKNQIGSDVCSGLFSQRIIDFIPQSRFLIKNKINSALLYFPRKNIKISFSKSFFVMNHFELDRMVSGLAEKAGVKMVLGQSISSLPEGFERIIGSDGWDSAVRQKLGLKRPNFRLGILGYVSKPLSSDFVEIWPHKENGFLWKIPRGENIEYGIIGEPSKINKIFDKFLKENNICLEKIKAKIIPQGFILSKNKSITLCGDAMGLTKPWSGGGVVWGLKAADLLSETFPDFSDYREKVKEFFKSKILFSKILTKLVYFFGFNACFLLPRNKKIESDFLF